jgi:NADH-quinone oxidoreductase subunit G
MPKVTVDGQELEVPDGATVLQACELAGKEIPRFCYHERLSIAGNCRMCLVEVKPGPPKPQASCALPAADNQESSPHADGQECARGRDGIPAHQPSARLPDLRSGRRVRSAGPVHDRLWPRGHALHENKRAVTEKYMGPIVKTIMTRCIHCTRCVRFAEEIAGRRGDRRDLGRGEDMQITTYLEHAVNSELSATSSICARSVR